MREAALELAGSCAVAQVNTEENPQLAGRFNISGIPALLLIRGGKVIDSTSGVLDKGALVAWCRGSLS